AAVAVRDGEPEPLLVQALTDPFPVRRAAAADALARAGAPGTRPAVRRLLRDPDTLVRLRVALALVEARDRVAVPVLIDLLEPLSRAPPLAGQGPAARDCGRRRAGAGRRRGVPGTGARRLARVVGKAEGSRGPGPAPRARAPARLHAGVDPGPPEQQRPGAGG